MADDRDRRGPRLRLRVDATPLLGRPTGIGVFCRCLLAALSERDDVDVGAFAVSWRRRRGLAAALPAGVAAHQRAMPARPLHAAWRRATVPPVEWFVGRCDVVHGTNFVVPPTRRAAPVVSVHDLTPLRFPEMCDASTLVFPELVRQALQRGAWVHADSSFVAAEIVEAFHVDPDRVRVVHPGTPPPRWSDSERGRARPATPTAAQVLPVGAGRYVLAVGTAEPRKDLPGLVAAFDELAHDRPDVALVLAGPDGWGAQELDRAVAASPFSSRVVRTGWLDDERLGDLLHGATVLAYPSRYEGFGFPPLEAMGAGVPVVATTAGALPEVLGDAAELVPPGDHQALAGALAEVLDSEARRAELVARGRRQAAAFTWEGTAQGLVDLYRDAAEAWRPR